MPESSRSRVDLPAPLCPTRATRPPSSMVMSMSWRAWMTGTLRSSELMLPPTMPRTAFFSERVLASKMGKSTLACRVSMRTTWLFLSADGSDPVGDARAVAAHRPHGHRPAEGRDGQDDDPVVPDRLLAEHRPPDDLDEVQDGVDLGDARALGDGRVRAVEEVLVDPHDRREEERELHDAADDRVEVAEPAAGHAEEQRDPGPVDGQQE